MRVIAFRFVAIAAFLALGTGVARADSVTAYLNSTGPDSITAYWATGGTRGSYTYESTDSSLGPNNWTNGTETTDHNSDQLFGSGTVPNFTTFGLGGPQSVTVGADNTFTAVWIGDDIVGEVPNFTYTTLAELTALYDDFYSSSFTTTQADAFQLAVWQIAYVGDTTIDDISDSNTVRFYISSSNGNGAAVELANAWLQQEGTAAYTGHYRISVLTSLTLEDQIVVTPVPLPSAAGMSLLTLSVLGVVAAMATRRRQSA